MAFSKSAVGAQNIILCQLCETDPKIKWKCVECELLMCEKCHDKIHPKFKNASYHEIVNIQDIGLQEKAQKKKPNFNDIKCKTHGGEVCGVFCCSCNKFVCRICTAKEHNGHTFIGIREAYDIKYEQLKKEHRNATKYKEDMIRGLQELRELKPKEDSKSDKVLQDIQVHKNALFKEINQYTEKLSNEVQQKRKTITDSISNEEKKVEDGFTQTEVLIQWAESMSSMTDIPSFFHEVDEFEKSLRKGLPSINLSHGSVPIFVPGEIKHSNIGTLPDDFGAGEKIGMKVTREFQTKMVYIQFMSICRDGSFWIGDDSSRVLQKVKLEGNKVKTMSTFKTDLFGLSLNSTDDLLFSDIGPTLKQIGSIKGKVTDSIYRVIETLHIMAVHITHNNKVIVGAITAGLDNSVFLSVGRKVLIVMDERGVHEKVYEYDSKKNALFTYPRSISSTTTGTLCVVDTLSKDDKGRLVFIEAGNSIVFYSGHPVINTDSRPFRPVTIVTTPSNNFIVKDLNKPILHILNSLGHLITTYNTKSIGIECPYSLAYSRTGHLYIGCTGLLKCSDKAKLYELEISGC